MGFAGSSSWGNSRCISRYGDLIRADLFVTRYVQEQAIRWRRNKSPHSRFRQCTYERKAHQHTIGRKEHMHQEEKGIAVFFFHGHRLLRHFGTKNKKLRCMGKKTVMSEGESIVLEPVGPIRWHPHKSRPSLSPHRRHLSNRIIGYERQKTLESPHDLPYLPFCWTMFFFGGWTVPLVLRLTPELVSMLLQE